MANFKYKRFQKLLAIIFIAFLTLSQVSSVSALTLEQQRDYYAQQAAQAKKNAEAKKQQAATVQQNINQISTEVSATQSSINSTQDQIDQTQATLKTLGDKINDDENHLAEEKSKLNTVIASWYMEGDTGLFDTLISANSISEITDKQEYYDSIKTQIDSMMDKIQQDKLALKKIQDDQNKQLTQLNDLKQSQADQRAYLVSRQQMQSRLLSDTNNALVDYQAEQKTAEQQVAALQKKINEIAAASSGAGGDVVSGSSQSYYYKQGFYKNPDGSCPSDVPWCNYKMGRYATIGTYGCLLTSLTMVADFYGGNYTPMTAAQNSSFNRSGGSQDGALISTSIVRDHGSVAINWGVVDSELQSGHPVVAGIALGVDMGNSYGVSHFVVLTSKLSDGRYSMLDPLGPSRGYKKSQVKAMRLIDP